MSLLKQSSKKIAKVPSAGRAPRNLTDAAELLAGILDTPQIVDCLGNETAANFAAMNAAIVECRDALAAIETTARKELASWAKHHRKCLAEIESLQLPNV